MLVLTGHLAVVAAVRDTKIYDHDPAHQFTLSCALSKTEAGSLTALGSKASTCSRPTLVRWFFILRVARRREDGYDPESLTPDNIEIV